MGQYDHFETEQDEKSFAARIWWVLWIVALLALAYSIYHHTRSFNLVHNGTCIEAEYYVYNGEEIARYTDENNRHYSYNLSGLDAIHEENTVKLYYIDRIQLAEPRRDPKIWIFSYLGFGAAIVFCSYKLVKIYWPKQIAKTTHLE